MADILTLIKKPNSRVYRKAYIKRRSPANFESSWLEITKYIKKWGKVSSSIDAEQFNKFKFNNVKLTIENSSGLFNPNSDENSLWYGLSNQQRTLVKIETGFLEATVSSKGVWTSYYLPESIWDSSYWDTISSWDSEATCFNGIISGDVLLSDNDEVSFTIKPLNQVFIDYAAVNISGYTTGGMTASTFVRIVRDHTDGSGNFIFRPFFGDTTSNWDISTTTNILATLDSAGSSALINNSVWDIIQKLAEAENFVPYISRAGEFKFVSRSSVDTATAYQFYGVGSHDTQYGMTIKKINSYGQKISKYYSKVVVKHTDSNTTTAYSSTQSSMVVSGTNNPWGLGERMFSIENFFIATSTVANAVCTTIFNEVSSLKNEIDFTTTFVPHLNIFDRVNITYDASPSNKSNLWDQNDWVEADNTTTALIFDSSRGDAIKLNAAEFKFLSIEMDLDNFECRFIAREI